MCWYARTMAERSGQSAFDSSAFLEWKSPDPDTPIHLVPIDWLKPHEEIRQKNAEQLRKMTLRWGGYTRPLLVDRHSGSILDGHHRHDVGIRLGLRLLPVILFDYFEDDSIHVEVWPGGEFKFLSKQDIVEMSLSDEVFAAKTSRHIVEGDIPPIMVPLDVLRQPSRR